MSSIGRCSCKQGRAVQEGVQQQAPRQLHVVGCGPGRQRKGQFLPRTTTLLDSVYLSCVNQHLLYMSGHHPSQRTALLASVCLGPVCKECGRDRGQVHLQTFPVLNLTLWAELFLSKRNDRVIPHFVSQLIAHLEGQDVCRRVFVAVLVVEGTDVGVVTKHQRQGCGACKSKVCAGKDCSVDVNSSTASATGLRCLQKQGVCRPAVQCGCHQRHTPGDHQSAQTKHLGMIWTSLLHEVKSDNPIHQYTTPVIKTHPPQLSPSHKNPPLLALTIKTPHLSLP